MTKTAGYRHDSIPSGIAAIQAICDQLGWDLTATEDAALFTVENLESFSGVVFLSTTGDILDTNQETAFRSFIESGGSFMGVHAATDTEPDWPWYRDYVGAHFDSHPEIQSAHIHLDVTDHPATSHLSDPWIRADEWYNFDLNPRANVNVLLTLDEETYIGGAMGDHPISWTREVGDSRLFYTALGHTASSYSEPEFLTHLAGGMQWALRVE
jgi:type 1 glutamine amidotransferase